MRRSYSDEQHQGPTMYLVASNPEVLNHLLKNEGPRVLNPALYDAPASKFNTIEVDFAKDSGSRPLRRSSQVTKNRCKKIPAFVSQWQC